MVKLIAILVAAMPIILFLRTVLFKQSKVMKETSSAFRKRAHKASLLSAPSSMSAFTPIATE
jgi:hypothetical protein